MALTNFQRVLIKTEDLHKIVVEISSCEDFAQKAPKSPKKPQKAPKLYLFSKYRGLSTVLFVVLAHFFFKYSKFSQVYSSL